MVFKYVKDKKGSHNFLKFDMVTILEITVFVKQAQNGL